MYFSIDDASYWFERTGEGPPVVMLHGFTGSSQTWKKLVAAWQDTFEVITIDLPGHGKTNTETPRTMEKCCQDVKKLLNHLQLTSIHLVGYSMGGRTALTFAMMFPSHVQSLTLESSSPGLEDVLEREKRVIHDTELATKIEKEGITAFVDFWENIPLFQTQLNLPTNLKQEVRVERLAQSEAGLSQSLRYMGTGVQPSWWGSLEQLDVPVLLVVGSLDEKFLQLNKKMRESLPNSRLAVVENTGHAIHVEQSNFFGKIVLEFIFQHSLPIT
ncbi:2-succinyl-6-hydroxy-2,4-cyclohexadiene-1-carboxylate synthase [Lentibacillus sp. Marseille-P4043]|uniref:2-succinyl-6-hydroxy-2, 4-cyclohexadiene-1-carboxylate synthase n=1 Tax=Lentibacillus sp. Marseille-P4043 TaxID=2040293 RepID=UPI000D0B2C60|nr:2-succinyl-6-hydroxy-2,4-cyclohexadiene-1-carboxylate synthase [Lentibacillus sp. Marseille-P4043]